MSGKMTQPCAPGTPGYTAWLDSLLEDARHGWSIGSFGAVGEFVRDPDEIFVLEKSTHARSMHTPRAAMRIRLDLPTQIVAYDTLCGDGVTWGHSLAFCLPRNDSLIQPDTITSLGTDISAIRPQDRDDWLFDLGVSIGHVRFCLRTADETLRKRLMAMQKSRLFGADGAALMAEVLRAQPHRVLLSPLGRIEVFAPIPPADGESPEGPHTHLLPGLIKSGRTHDANAPIPAGYQPVLMFNPRSPWRDAMGRRVAFDRALDRDFLSLLACFGLPEEIRIRSKIQAAIDAGVQPQAFVWPKTRRARAVARLTLRRIAQQQPSALANEWRARHDHAEAD